MEQKNRTRNLNEMNPELHEGDRIILIQMDGESYPVGSKGIVKGKINQPKFSATDPGYGYAVEWYDPLDDTFIGKLPLLPEADAWIFDREYYQS